MSTSFLVGFLMGVLICLICSYVKMHDYYPSRLPPDRQCIEFKNGIISFDGYPSFQDVPCKIEVCHRYTYSYDDRCHSVEYHVETRRYRLQTPLPADICMSGECYFETVDSDGVKCTVYVGSQKTLIEGGYYEYYSNY